VDQGQMLVLVTWPERHVCSSKDDIYPSALLGFLEQVWMC